MSALPTTWPAGWTACSSSRRRLRGGRTAAEVEQAVREQLDNIITGEISEQELARVKAQVVSSDVYERDSMFYQAMILGIFETTGLPWRLADEYVARIQAISAEQVKQVAEKNFHDDGLTVAVLEPQSGTGSRGCAAARQAEMSMRADNGVRARNAAQSPALARLQGGSLILAVVPVLLLLGAQAARPAPLLEHWQTAAGSQVYFVESHELPMVDMRLLFDAGTVREPAGRNGLAVLTNSLLDEGAGELDATAVSFEFERLGAQYGAASGYDYASVSLRSLSDPALLEPALLNLRRVVAEPAFPEKAVARQKQRLLVAIERKQQSPGEIARDAYHAAIYGDHPYALPNDGTRDSVMSVQRRDIVNFHRDRYGAGNARLVIVGGPGQGAG